MVALMAAMMVLLTGAGGEAIEFMANKYGRYGPLAQDFPLFDYVNKPDSHYSYFDTGFVGCLIDCLIAWLFGCLIVWLFDCLIDIHIVRWRYGVE